jgi:hypothetical protein
LRLKPGNGSPCSASKIVEEVRPEDERSEVSAIDGRMYKLSEQDQQLLESLAHDGRIE